MLIDKTTGIKLPWNSVVATWNSIAKNFDTVAFNTLSTRAPVAWGLANPIDASLFVVPNSSARNFPVGQNEFGLYSYFGYNGTGYYPATTPEAFTPLGAVVGGTLAGIDYSNKIVPGYNGEARDNDV